MAVRRLLSARAPLEGVERLLDWSRHRHVAPEFLEHPDADVRRLAEATEAAFRALVRWAGCDHPTEAFEERSKADLIAAQRRLTQERRAFAESRGLVWRPREDR